MTRSDEQLYGQMHALQLVVAFLLARETRKSTSALPGINELLVHELQERLKLTPELEAHAVASLDSIMTLASAIHTRFRGVK